MGQRMPDLVQFLPQPRRRASANVKAFVRICRNELTVFGRSLVWEENYWKPAGVTFGNLDQTSPKLDPAKVMQEPFLSFAKAYLRYQQGHSPTKTKVEMRALKCIERALCESGSAPDIVCATMSTLDRAADLAKARFSPGMAYHTGREIERLAKFVSEKRLVLRTLDWRSPIRRPEDTVRTGKEAKERREAKLPTDEALEALAQIFASAPKVDRDILTTSTAAMLLSAPSRASALLLLLEQCEVVERKRDGSHAYGWRFPSDKGAEPSIKWVPDVMVDVAKEAIARLRRATAEGRRLAVWLEKRPDEFYRHAKCPDVSEDQPLSVREAADALGITSESDQYCRTELRRLGMSSRNNAHTLRSLNVWVHKHLPDGFPWIDREKRVKFSEALFCFRSRQLRVDAKSASPVLLAPTNINVLNNDLGHRKTKGDYGPPGIFQRHGYTRGDGKPIKLTTHQFRHLLNTIAQRGGLGQVEIARWSGRVDGKQNRAYDHMSEFELVDLLRKHDSSLTLDQPLEQIAQRLAALVPITRQEFNTLTTPTAHVTEFGFCVHDFVMSPCQRFRDCLNCSEQVCIKGDRRIDRIRAKYAQVMALKERADREIADGTWGADRWYEIHALTAKRLSELIVILERPDIPDGAIVRLKNDEEFSRVRMVLDSKAEASQLVKDGHASTALLKHHGKAPN